MIESPYLNTKSAVVFLGGVVSESTLNHLRVKGGGPIFIKMGRNVAYDKRDLMAWADNLKRASTSEHS